MTKINYGEVMQNFREEIEALSKKDKKEIEQKIFLIFFLLYHAY